MFLVTFAAGGGYTADFAEAACSAEVMHEVKRCRALTELVVPETDRGLDYDLAPDGLPVPLSDPKSLPASGVVGTDAAQPIHQPQVDVERLLPGLDNNLGFVDLKDGDTLPIAQTHVRVKGQASSSFKLSVNGSEVSEARVGKKAVLAEQRLLVWEFIGIPLKAGRNTLTVRQIDPFGNDRGMRSIHLIAPDRLGSIEIHLPQTPIADGHTALPVTVRLTDAKGVPITVRTPLTEATAVRWQVEDLDPREPGVQVFIDGGKAEYRLLPPHLFGSSRREAALGGDYQFWTRGRVYGRHELISSLSGPFALNQPQENHNTVIGIDTDFLKDANLFTEYRASDAFDGRSTQAAIGTRNAWHLFEGLSLHTSAEQVKALESAGTGFDSDSQAYTGALEYTGHPLWKASGRVEYYHASNAESWLNTLGLAHKLDRDWTFLGRSILAVTESKGAAADTSLQHRLQLGVAYRDTETNVWNALMRYEHKYEDGSPRVGFGLNTTEAALDLHRTVDALSLHYSYQPERSWVLSGRIAAKYVQEDSFGIKSGYDTELLMGRYTMDLTERWDIGLQASALAGEGFKSVQFGFGPEAGYRVAENLWGSAGYNLFGFKDEDLGADEPTDQGVYVRLRFQFDEELFKPVMDLLK